MRTIDAGLFSRQGTPVPLLGVGVDGQIVGQGARITVSQRFRNEENQAIEAVYKFPLPEGARWPALPSKRKAPESRVLWRSGTRPSRSMTMPFRKGRGAIF